ncbi:hypothetical protein AB0K00_32325 [Dactylosporangium sp. NPDC049525]|uniref:hypothetical protein n=1 Tax=Dactylosporangium sp. NPDC049525 TaxID=3154730 RepID=UPI00342F57FA
MQRSTTEAPAVRTQVRADGLATNHSQAVSAGRGLTINHSQAVATGRGLSWNHSQAVTRLV